jgi:HlyD family secretion protein
MGPAGQKADAKTVHPHDSAVVAPAIVEAEGDVVTLSFEAGGRVDEVCVHAGDRVTRGAVLARLDDRLPRVRVKKAEAVLAAARARFDAVQNGARPDEIRAARADVDAAEAMATTREREAERAGQLHTADAISGAQVDADRGAASAARAQADAASARLALIRAGTRGEQRRELLAAVDAAQADLDEAHTLLAQTVLRAPKDGIILRRLVEPGEQVTTLPPTLALTLADADHVRLRAEVDEADIGRVAVGGAGYATAEAFGGRRFSGHIVHVERELGRRKVRNDDPRSRVDTRVLEVVMELDDPGALPLGLRMDAHLDER